MNVLVKSKNPVVEYSFSEWLKWKDDHLHEMEKFAQFAKTVCARHARKWKNTEYIRERILRVEPNFDLNKLQCLMIIFEYLLEFHSVKSLRSIPK